MIGVGHSPWQKTYDGFFKARILRQSTGAVTIPVSVSFVPTIPINTLKPNDFPVKLDSGTTIRQLSYVFRLLIVRKFTEGFSLQLMPTFIYADNISFFLTVSPTYKLLIL